MNSNKEINKQCEMLYERFMQIQVQLKQYRGRNIEDLMIWLEQLVYYLSYYENTINNSKIIEMRVKKIETKLLCDEDSGYFDLNRLIHFDLNFLIESQKQELVEIQKKNFSFFRKLFSK